MENVFVFIPNNLERKIGFIQGFTIDNEEQRAFYITDNKIANQQSTDCIGYSSENSPNYKTNNCTSTNLKWLHVNIQTGEITLSNKNYPTIIYYNYEAFKKFEILDNSCEKHIQTLVEAIKRKQNEKHTKKFSSLINILITIVILILNLFNRLKPLLKYSATATHFESTINLIKWFLEVIKCERRLNLKLCNFIVVKIIDVSIGLFLLRYFLLHEQYILNFLQDSAEVIIQGLKQLLSILMGSPAGLKLNYAFNKTLGTFFFYNISLWRAFIHSMEPLLQSTFHLLVLPSALGLTFQAALFADLIGFATFHVYCIYVYAARLYGLQIKVLVSLWRLFIGRKFNPLRQRVDSYQYTHHQLFVGTLWFTVLLFLLPTTFLYYAVFTTLRLGIIALDSALLRLRHILYCLPLYVTFLWIFNSPTVAGSIHFCLKHTEHGNLYCTLKTLPLSTLVINSVPETLSPLPNISWKRILNSVITGILL